MPLREACRELASVNAGRGARGWPIFAAYAEAVSRGRLGWKAGTVISDYNENRRNATATQIEESPLAAALLERAPKLFHWYGTASELLAALNEFVGKKVTSAPGWPPIVVNRGLRTSVPHLPPNSASSVYSLHSRERGKSG